MVTSTFVTESFNFELLNCCARTVHAALVSVSAVPACVFVVGVSVPTMGELVGIVRGAVLVGSSVGALEFNCGTVLGASVSVAADSL